MRSVTKLRERFKCDNNRVLEARTLRPFRVHTQTQTQIALLSRAV